MIFNVPEHIDMIRNGTKTQTRRAKRGHYKLESERKNPHEIGYAVQRKRGAKGEPDIRIVMDYIGLENPICWLNGKPKWSIAYKDALAEGLYDPIEYEKVFKKLNPKWSGFFRYAFEFHVIEVRRNVPNITSHAHEERVKRTFYPEQTMGYPRL